MMSVYLRYSFRTLRYTKLSMALQLYAQDAVRDRNLRTLARTYNKMAIAEMKMNRQQIVPELVINKSMAAQMNEEDKQRFRHHALLHVIEQTDLDGTVDNLVASVHKIVRCKVAMNCPGCQVGCIRQDVHETMGCCMGDHGAIELHFWPALILFDLPRPTINVVRNLKRRARQMFTLTSTDIRRIAETEGPIQRDQYFGAVTLQRIFTILRQPGYNDKKALAFARSIQSHLSTPWGAHDHDVRAFIQRNRGDFLHELGQAALQGLINAAEE